MNWQWICDDDDCKLQKKELWVFTQGLTIAVIVLSLTQPQFKMVSLYTQQCNMQLMWMLYRVNQALKKTI